MLDVLLLRLDAPLMSFGSVVIDNLGRTSPFPGRSLLTGLFGNALGLTRTQPDLLSSLQDRLRHSVRRDRGGQTMLDYQTVALGQDFLQNERAWTSWGRLDARGGQSAEATHERFRYYLVDSAFTLAVTLRAGSGPSLSDLAQALDHPARPLFLGRKCCPPASRLLLSQTTTPTLRDAVKDAPETSPGPKTLWWPAGDSPSYEKHPIYLCDTRDWKNQVHVGRSCMYEEQS